MCTIRRCSWTNRRIETHSRYSCQYEGRRLEASQSWIEPSISRCSKYGRPEIPRMGKVKHRLSSDNCSLANLGDSEPVTLQ